MSYRLKYISRPAPPKHRESKKMKLSELSTAQAADILCEVGAYILNICADDELSKALNKKLEADGAASRAEIIEFGAKKIADLLPLVLNGHRDDVFGILAAINGNTAVEIAEQSIMLTMGQIKELVQDRDFIDFFKSCAPEAAV